MLGVPIGLGITGLDYAGVYKIGSCHSFLIVKHVTVLCLRTWMMAIIIIQAA